MKSQYSSTFNHPSDWIVTKLPRHARRDQNVRKQLRRQTARVLSALDQLIKTLKGSEMEVSVREQLSAIRGQLETAIQRIGDEWDGPVRDQPLGQWLESLLQEPRKQSSRLLNATIRSKNAASISSHNNMCRHLETCVAIIRTEVQDEEPCASLNRIKPNSDCGDDSKNMSLSDAKQDVSLVVPRPLVLVIAGDHGLRSELECKLSRFSYRVVCCSSPETAFDLLEQQRFDVCLTDVPFGNMTASELIKRVRQSPTSGEPSIIVVAGPAEKVAGADCIDKGADDCVFWPLDEKLLHSRILASLRRTNIRLSELSKYLPQDVLAEALKDRNLLETPRPADVSVMVCDVRGLSSTSDRVGPVQTIAWIRDVMNRLSRIVLDHGGTIVDYVGDEIMAMWGAPIASPRHASNACHCAMSIQSELKQLSAKWYPMIGTETRIGIGIGINSGLAVVGNTGSNHRIKYGPHGHTVNMASHVQGATKYLHSSVLIAQSTASRIDALECGGDAYAASKFTIFTNRWTYSSWQFATPSRWT